MITKRTPEFIAGRYPSDSTSIVQQKEADAFGTRKMSLPHISKGDFFRMAADKFAAKSGSKSPKGPPRRIKSEADALEKSKGPPRRIKSEADALEISKMSLPPERMHKNTGTDIGSGLVGGDTPFPSLSPMSLEVLNSPEEETPMMRPSLIKCRGKRHLPQTIKEIYEQHGLGYENRHKIQNDPFLVLIKSVFKVDMSSKALYMVQWPQGWVQYNTLLQEIVGMPSCLLGKKPFIGDFLFLLFTSAQTRDCEYSTATAMAIACRKDSRLRNKMLRAASDKQMSRAGRAEQQCKSKYRALFEVARALSSDPPELTPDHVLNLRKYYTTEQVDCVIQSLSLIAYKLFISDAFRCEVESSNLDVAFESLRKSGWKPKWGMPKGYRNAPDEMEAATEATISDSDDTSDTYSEPERLLFLWKAGVPDSWPQVCDYLKLKTGHNFPWIKLINICPRGTKAVASATRDHFCAHSTRIGLTTKAFCQLIWAVKAGEERLEKDACKMIEIFAAREGIDVNMEKTIELMKILARHETPETNEECSKVLNAISKIPGVQSEKVAAVLMLARSLLSPSACCRALNEEVVFVHLGPPEISETVSWLGVLPMIHRMLLYHDVKEQIPSEKWNDLRSSPIPLRRNSIFRKMTTL